MLEKGYHTAESIHNTPVQMTHFLHFRSILTTGGCVHKQLHTLLTDIVTLNAISLAKTVNLPNGYAWKAWENIKGLHTLSNHGTKNDLTHKFNHST
jgi:hypothetical protein